ncbi:hypothetical protein NYE67_05455 [Solibacillus sp. FSL W8-0474]|uniref:hypothetical protein n=1 Tax=Solibacillus sp. FSL W8-0474 TaxID=2975336 RepID=UPI0030F922B4
MLQGHFGIPHVDGAYWSLTVELTFYLVMGLILYCGFKDKIITISLIWLFFSACVMIYSNLNNHSLGNIIINLSISKYSHLFIAGIMFYLIKEKNKVYIFL